MSAVFFILLILILPAAYAQQGSKGEKTTSAQSQSRQPDSDSLFSKALQEKLSGNYGEALKLFRDFSQTNPDNATAHYEMARIYYLEFYDIPSALKEAEKAARLDASNKWMQEFYADMLAISEKKNEANAIYQELSEKEKLSRDYLIKQLSIYLDDEKYDEALQSIDRLLAQHQVDEEKLLVLKNDIFIRQKKYDSALSVVNQLIADDPQQPRYQVMLANVYENMQDTVRAEETLQRVREKFPNEPDAQYALLEYYLSKEDISNASKIFGQAIRNKNISELERNMLMSIFTISSRKDENASKHLKIELRESAYSEPPDPFLIKLYGQYLFFTQESDSAILQFKRLLAHDGVEQDVWNALVVYYVQQNNVDSMQHYARKALEQYPEDVNYLFVSAIAYQQQEQYDTAETMIRKTLAHFKKDSTYFFSLAQVYASLGDVSYFLKEYPASDSAFDYALILDPDNPSTLNNYSFYLSERNIRLEDAEKMSAKSLELRPDEATFLDTYGWIQYRKGNYKTAKKYIEKAVGLSDASHPDAALYEHLGDVELKLGNRRKALAHWKKAAELPGASQEIKDKIAAHQ